MKTLVILLLLIPLLVTTSLGFAGNASASVDSSKLGKAIVEIENLDAVRLSLAEGLKDRSEPPDMETFKQVCKPVGMRAKQLAEENGWQVQQIARKYRNPDHAPDSLSAKVALAQFEQRPELMGFWQEETVKGQKGTRYYRRIDVQASCLACHGAKSGRPGFIVDKYPLDLAYDFKEGDLRGMYSVFIPELEKALAE